MQNAEGFYTLEQYGPFWFFAGALLLLSVAVWYGFVFWSTRRKPQKSVNTLPAKDPVRPDINALKAKYLALIAEVGQGVSAGTITTRIAHQKLSLLVRYFVFEANGFRAHVLTLSDIKRTGFTTVAGAVEQYYPAEFAAIEQGDVATAITIAKEVVSAWS